MELGRWQPGMLLNKCMLLRPRPRASSQACCLLWGRTDYILAWLLLRSYHARGTIGPGSSPGATSVGSTGAASVRTNGPCASCEAIEEDRRERPRARQGDVDAAEAGPTYGRDRQTFRRAAPGGGAAGGHSAKDRIGFEADTEGLQGRKIKATQRGDFNLNRRSV